MGVIHYKDFTNAYIPEILQEIYIKKVYKPYLYGKKERTIIDCGANIGLTAMYFSQFAKQVYALEPAKQHVEILTKNIEDNEIKNVTIIPKALSNVNGTTKFFHSPNTTMFSLSSAVTNPNDYEEVETITFDKLFKDNNIEHVDLCKVDTEGHEAPIIASEGFAKVADKIDTIICEWHQWSTCKVDIFISSLRDRGFDVDWIKNTDASILVAKHI